MGDSELFMARALMAAQKSSAEPGRISPMVGVVVVKDGDVLAEAFRGEFADGDHAEYTALERKLAGRSLAGADVYTTLEPCTSRNPPKVPCARRLIERGVGRVFIGMLDPDLRVHGRGVMDLRAAGIDVQLFSKALATGVEKLNQAFARDRRAPQGLGARVGETETFGALRIVTRSLGPARSACSVRSSAPGASPGQPATGSSIVLR